MGIGNLTCTSQSRFVKVSCIDLHTITRPSGKTPRPLDSGRPLVLLGPRIAAYAVPNFPGLSDDFVHPIGPTILFPAANELRPFWSLAPTGPNGGHGPIELAGAFW
jgi:hypothetical protein